ncbi:MAG: hypothetical protein ACOCXQ_02780 [Patescibacteria group bacterium]
MNVIDRRAILYGFIGLLLGSSISFAFVNHQLETRQKETDYSVAKVQPEYLQLEGDSENIDALIDYHEAQLNQLNELKEQSYLR